MPPYIFSWRHYSESLLANEALDAFRQHGKINFSLRKGHNDPNTGEKCGQRRRNISSYGLHLHEAIRLHLKCDGTCAETRFHLSAKRTSPFNLAGASFQSTTGSQGACISGSNAGYTVFRGSVKGTGYPLHFPISPSLPLPLHHRVPSHFNRTLLLSFQSFPKCNLRAFLTKAETSCGYLNKGSTDYVLNFKFKGSLRRNNYISTRKGSEEEKFLSILICFSLQIVCFTDILFDCLHLPLVHKLQHMNAVNTKSWSLMAVYLWWKNK
jgi:hypothetical protein